MRKWKTLGKAFENVGNDLRIACENMETICEDDEFFEGMYVLYTMLLDTLKAQQRFIGEVFYKICNR